MEWHDYKQPGKNMEAYLTFGHHPYRKEKKNPDKLKIVMMNGFVWTHCGTCTS